MEAVSIRAEVIAHYCTDICQAQQGQCLAICPLRIVAEINRRMDDGATLESAAFRVMKESADVLTDVNRWHDTEIKYGREYEYTEAI